MAGPSGVLACVLACVLVAASPATAILFNTTFGSDMVLQQAPAKSAVYGTLNVTAGADAAPTVTVSLKSGSSAATEVTATVTGAQWLAYLPPTKADLARDGPPTTYTVTATCTAGCTDSGNSSTLSRVVFGDVWYCSGQSNMALPLLHTMSRNKSMAAIQAGQYSNIRLYDIRGNMNPDTAWTTLKDAVTANVFFTFSGTCYYFGEGLTDKLGDAAPPIGLIHTAWGGSTIGQWLTNATRNECKNTTDNASDQEWHDSRVMPFVKMSIKGWTWYQGENDMHAFFGNSLYNTGYACMMPKLVSEWRSLWSAEPGTTDPSAPFGLVTLAPSGGEGGRDIGTMRWAQSAGFGVVPNEAMPNTFLAQAFDLNDPFRNTSCYYDGCCPNNYKPKNSCNGCKAYCANLTATNFYMGPIHPRDKKPVGQRLAQAAVNTAYGGKGAFTGPTISGCKKEGNTITVTFNKTLLGPDSVVVQPYPKAFNASKFDVLLNASLFCMQSKKISSHSTECIDDGTGMDSGAGNFDAAWVPVDIASASSTSITVDLSKSGGTAFAIRYGWTGDCCSEFPPTSDPCPVASCPLMGSSGFPANPFVAKIVGDKCACVAPQVCDE